MSDREVQQRTEARQKQDEEALAVGRLMLKLAPGDSAVHLGVAEDGCSHKWKVRYRWRERVGDTLLEALQAAFKVEGGEKGAQLAER